jgi:hypothetical protein
MGQGEVAGDVALVRMGLHRQGRTVEAVIYVASRKKNAGLLRAMRDTGVPIISTWIDSVDSGRIPKPAQSQIWRDAFKEIAECKAFVFHDGGDNARIELGIALGMGVDMVISTDRFMALDITPVIFSPTLEEALLRAESYVACLECFSGMCTAGPKCVATSNPPPMNAVGGGKQ